MVQEKRALTVLFCGTEGVGVKSFRGMLRGFDVLCGDIRYNNIWVSYGFLHVVYVGTLKDPSELVVEKVPSA